MNAIRAFFARSFTLGQCFAWLGLALALLLLSAHFYRAGEYGLALCSGGMLLFLCLSSVWKQYAVALFLVWGAAEWGHSAYFLAKTRILMNIPWLRGAAILIAVALLTLLAAKYAFSRARKKDSENSRALFQGAVYIIVFLLLFFLRQTAPLNFLLLERYVPLFGSVQIFFASWYAAFIAGKLIDPRQSRKSRKLIWLLFGLIFFAQFFFGLAGFDRMLLTGDMHVPIPAFIIFAPLFRNSMSVMPIIVIIATVLAGSAWCSLLCYFGCFDALAAGGKKAAPASAFSRFALRYGRIIILVTGIAAAFGLRALGIPLPTAIAIAVAYAIFSLLIMATLSRRQHMMFHCTSVCPLGLLVSLLGRLSPWRVKVRPQLCDNCGACEAVCRYAAISPESRAKGKTHVRCSLCRDCISVCTKQAIVMHCPGLSPQHAWTLFVGLTSILHVLFLSVAMV